MSSFKQWLKDNDIGVGSVIAFAVVPAASGITAAFESVDWVSLTPGQEWSLVKATFASIGVGLVGRFGQAIASKWGERQATPAADPVTPGSEAPAIDPDADDLGDLPQDEAA